MGVSVKQKIKKLEAFNTEGMYLFNIIKSGSFSKPGIHKVYGKIRTDTEAEANVVIKRTLGKSYRGSLVLSEFGIREPVILSGTGVYGESFGGGGFRPTMGYDRPGTTKRKGIFD